MHLESNGIPLIPRELQTHSNPPEYHDPSSNSESRRDSPLNSDSVQIYLSSSPVSIISGTDSANLDRQMDTDYNPPTEAVLVEEPIGQSPDNTYSIFWEPVQLGTLGAASVERKSRRQNGARRCGPLASEVAKGATKVRKVGACLECRVSKCRVSYSVYRWVLANIGCSAVPVTFARDVSRNTALIQALKFVFDIT